MAGKLVIFSGPSGAGKSTIVSYLRSIEKFNLEFSISATSRQKRPNETDGVDYYFLSIDEFKTRTEDNDFLEWEEVYPRQYYGTLKSEVERLTKAGKNIIFDIDVVGGAGIKRKFKEQAVSVFIQPPSLDELANRLKIRNTDDEKSMEKRLKKAKLEMTYARRFDHVIINKNLDTAKKEAEEIVDKFLSMT